MKLILTLLAALVIIVVSAQEQKDYQSKIWTYQNLFACNYLAEHQVNQESTYAGQLLSDKDKLKMFYKMVTYCRTRIDKAASQSLVQAGLEGAASLNVAVVRQWTNAEVIQAGKSNLEINEEDIETIELLFAVSLNEDGTHGKMPSFGNQTDYTKQATNTDTNPTQFAKKQDPSRFVPTAPPQQQQKQQNSHTTDQEKAKTQSNQPSQQKSQVPPKKAQEKAEEIDNWGDSTDDEEPEASPIPAKQDKQKPGLGRVPSSQDKPKTTLSQEDFKKQFNKKNQASSSNGGFDLIGSISSLFSPSVLVVILLGVLFMMYQRSQAEQLRMLLKIKELEAQTLSKAVVSNDKKKTADNDDGGKETTQDSKKKKKKK